MSTNYIKLLKKIIYHFPEIEIDVWIHPNRVSQIEKILPDKENIKFTSDKFLLRKRDNTILFIAVQA